jgi:hypothetical protein
LPGQGDSRLLDAFDDLIATLRSIDQTLKDARESISQAKSTSIDKLVTTLTAPLNRADSALTAVSDRLDQADQGLAQGRTDLTAFRDRVNNIFTWAAVIGTLVLLWMALAQIGLFIHAYGVFTGRDPLARWHKRGAGQTAPLATPTAA